MRANQLFFIVWGVLSFVSFDAISFQGYKLLSYNILGDSNIKYGDYHLLPNEIIDWDLRKYRLIDKISHYDADIVFLQEINTSACDFFKEYLAKHNYSGTCAFDLATFYKQNKFKLYDRKELKYRYGKGALSITLEDSATNLLDLVNVHLKWDNKPPEEHIGCRQILELSYFIRGFRHGKRSILSVIGGDFNFGPDHKCLRSINQYYVDSHVDNPYSTFYGENIDRIDYIFHSKGWKASSLAVVQPLLLDGKLPTVDEPSDHTPVVVEIKPDN